MDASERLYRVCGVVKAIRVVGRHMTFVDLQFDSPLIEKLELDDEHQPKYGIHLADLSLCDASALATANPLPDAAQTCMQAVLHTEVSTSELETQNPLVFLIWKQLLVGSVWIAVGPFGQSKRCVIFQAF